jgi:hypothetical protein
MLLAQLVVVNFEKKIMKFLSLSCAWRNIILFNYRIDPKILTPFLPRYTAIDLLKANV